MSHTRRVLFWRHGRTAWNAEKRFQGHTDIELDSTGHTQAERAAELLATLRPDAIIASDLRRAADTAGYLARSAKLPVEFDKRLRERSGGSWEGLTRTEIAARWPVEQASMDIPDGEDIAQVGDRMLEAVERGLAGLPEHGLLAVVSHGAALRVLIARMLGIPDERRWAIGALSNCSWSVLEPRPDGTWSLAEHNAASLPEPVVLSDDT